MTTNAVVTDIRYFDVTQDHIAKGRNKHHRLCPIAIAMGNRPGEPPYRRRRERRLRRAESRILPNRPAAQGMDQPLRQRGTRRAHSHCPLHPEGFTELRQHRNRPVTRRHNLRQPDQRAESPTPRRKNASATPRRNATERLNSTAAAAVGPRRRRRALAPGNPAESAGTKDQIRPQPRRRVQCHQIQQIRQPPGLHKGPRRNPEPDPHRPDQRHHGPKDKSRQQEKGNHNAQSPQRIGAKTGIVEIPGDPVRTRHHGKRRQRNEPKGQPP